MKRDARVIRALDDLANELSLHLLRTSAGSETVLEDPQGSLYGTLKDVELSFRQHDRATAKDPPDSPASLNGALATLSPEQRHLLQLHLVDGRTCLEIATRANRSREAVLFDLVRAYSHLRLHLGGEYIVSIYDRE